MNNRGAVIAARVDPVVRRAGIGRLLLLAIGAASLASPAGAQAVDTSEWTCEFCPFEDGYRADYDVGTTVVSDDSAWFGNATGYDDDGAYLNLSGNGSYVQDELIWGWRLHELGLDSRSAEGRLRQPGLFEVDVGYSEIPRREFITTRTIFAQAPSGGGLMLPSGWVRAGSTGAFTALEENLVDRDIESDRSILEFGGTYLPSRRWSLSARYRSQERDGNNILGGSYFTVSSLLPVPFDYETDEVDLEASFATDRGFLSVAWYLSDFQSGGSSFGWETPFTSAPGAEFAALAQPPNNSFQQLSLSGGYRFATLDSYVRAAASLGRIDQDSALLDYTTNATLDAGPLPRNRLNGEVDTTRLSISAGARPLPRARIEFRGSYEERDNATPRETWARVIADSFLSGDPELNNPYSFERTRLELEGSYDPFDSTRLTGGIEYRQIDRDLQEVAEQDEVRGWGGVRWRPTGGLTLYGELGTARRDIDRYDEGLAQNLGQNPILRKYNLAYRYREFAEFGADGAFVDGRLGWSVSATIYDDAYSESRLGLISGDERAFAGEINWAVSDRASAYLHGGFEAIESVQTGSEAFDTPDWRAINEDQFVTFGAGFRIRGIAEKMDLEIDGVFSDGVSEILMNTAAAGDSRFPDLETTMKYVNARLSYAWSEQLNVAATFRYQHFDADDWSLDGVEPATIAQVLSLGADPWDEEQFIVGLSFRYVAGPDDDN